MPRKINSLRDLEREPADWAGAFKVLGVAVLLVIGTSVGYHHGAADTAQLALDAYAREQQYRGFLSRIVATEEQAMSIVAREDWALHEQVAREVPGWTEMRGLAVAVLAEDGS